MTDFIATAKYRKLLVAPKVFKTVNHRFFREKQIVDFRGGKWIMLPFDDVTHTILVRHNFEPPSPIEYYYHWPGRFKPFKHQIVQAAFFATYERCYCLSEMGTGKTQSALWAADYLISRGIHRSVLIVAPLSTIETVWGDAIFEHFPHRTFQVVHGSIKKRLQALETPADFYILNHDGLKVNKVIEHLKHRSDITLVIADELAVFRNQKTQRYKELYNFAGPDTERSLWGLTGAPMPNGPEGIWAQAKLVNPSLVPKYFNRFRHEVMLQITPFKWLPKRGWEDRCYSMLKPAIRYETKDCLDLPPISYITHEVSMSTEQKHVYDRMMLTCVAEAKEGKITALNEGVKLIKLLQIATGYVYTSERDIAQLNPAPKINALTELIYETNRKCIVFTPFVHNVDQVYRALKKIFNVAIVYGATSAKKRDDIFREFQLGKLEVLLAHPQCMAHGVTLTAAHHIIWYAPIDNYEIYEQANARIRRASQTKHQNIIHLLCSPIEKRVYERLKSKEKTQGLLLDLLKRI